MNSTDLSGQSTNPFLIEHQFEEAFKSGTSMAVTCAILGIALSTGYYWRKQWLAKGDGWYKSPKRKHSPRKQKPYNDEADFVLMIFTELEPLWGCDRLAAECERQGIKISSPTVQKMLIKLGLGRTRERISALLDAETLGEELNDHQRSIIKKRTTQLPQISPGLRRGQSVIQDSYMFKPKFESEKFRAHLIIDTFDGRVICRLSREVNAQSACNVMGMAIDKFRWVVEKMYDARGVEFSYVVKRRRNKDVVPRTHVQSFSNKKPQTGKKRALLMQQAWFMIKHGFLRPLLCQNRQGELSTQELNAKLEIWLANQPLLSVSAA